MVRLEHWCRDSEISFGAARQCRTLVSDDCPEAERIRNRYRLKSGLKRAGITQLGKRRIAGKRGRGTYRQSHLFTFPCPCSTAFFRSPVSLLPFIPRGHASSADNTAPQSGSRFPLLSSPSGRIAGGSSLRRSKAGQYPSGVTLKPNSGGLGCHLAAPSKSTSTAAVQVS